MIETKVIAATAGGATGGVVGSFVLWLLGVVVWHVPNDAQHSIQAVAAVPEPAGGFALFVLAGLMAFAGGWLAPHTSRPDLQPAHAFGWDPSTWPGPSGKQAPATTPADPEAPAAGVPPATETVRLAPEAATTA